MTTEEPFGYYHGVAAKIPEGSDWQARHIQAVELMRKYLNGGSTSSKEDGTVFTRTITKVAGNALLQELLDNGFNAWIRW